MRTAKAIAHGIGDLLLISYLMGLLLGILLSLAVLRDDAASAGKPSISWEEEDCPILDLSKVEGAGRVPTEDGVAYSHYYDCYKPGRID